ncbi:MAG: nucleoside-diphosphate sugar epimerase/dehydratase [Planctomycetaceae bacterium]
MRHRLAAILPAYVLACFASYGMAFWIRFEFEPSAARLAVMWTTLPVVIGFKLLIAAGLGEFRRSFRYATISDLIYVALTCAVATTCLALMNLVLPADMFIPRSVLAIDAALSFLLIGSVRSTYLLSGHFLTPWLDRTDRDRTLIWDVQQHSVGILRMLSSTTASKSPYAPVGFIQPQEVASPHSMIGSLPVYSTTLGWRQIVAKSNATQLLIPGGTPGRIVRQLFRECTEVGIKVHVIPSVDELVDGRFKLSVRDLTVSDLLRRDPNQLDLESIQHYVTGKRVLVTGGAGSIGSELCRQIASLKPEKLVIFDQSEFGVFSIEREFAARELQDIEMKFVVADVLDERLLQQVMEEHQPHLVFHAAAYKHVPLMEDNPQAAVLNNILGTKAVADAASRNGVERFVLISTDKAVRPTSVMGASKLLAEKYVQSISTHSSTQFITVRFGNVLNSMGSVVPTFRRQIEAGGPVTVTHPDMERFFMTIPEAVQLVLQAGAIGNSGDILILDMGEPVKIVDLAKDMIMLSGLKYPEDIDIAFTGLRPGEKLYEELFYAGESEARRVHEKIFCGDNDNPPPAPLILKHISLLEEAATSDRRHTLEVLRDIVAEYTHEQWVPSRLRAAA